MKKLYLPFLFLLFINLGYGQFIPEHISNRSIYLFLDEMASAKIISLNFAVMPFSKAYIAGKLVETGKHRDQLTKRQARELDFYLRAYRPDLAMPDTLQWREKFNFFKKNKHLATSLAPFGLTYKDSLFTSVIRPIYGIQYSVNEKGSVTHTWGGVEGYGTIGGHWGFYASLRDNHINEILAFPGYFTQEMGGNFKINEGGRKGGDWSEMRAGITYGWKWGDVGLVKDHFAWGTNYHGANIFSGRTPSFAHLRLHIFPAKWIDFNYVHGLLVSEVVDSANSYYTNGAYRQVYRAKYISANMITLIPFRNLNISIGNSIIYSDMNGIQIEYLIPLSFFKSIDHTYTHGMDNENSQMFLNIESYNIKHLHLFATVYIDDFSTTRIANDTRHNFISGKGGFSLNNWPLRDVILRCEYTCSNPMVYKHYVPTLTFESNKFNLGSYLRDNSTDFYSEITWMPFQRLQVTGSYLLATHYNEYAYTNGFEAERYPLRQDKTWQSQTISIGASYQFASNCYLVMRYDNGDIQGFSADGHQPEYYLNLFTPKFYQGKTNTFTAGFNFGF
ncbi:MAG: hypothetical protein ACM3N9_03230 [Syntrophothermus sp.]